MKVDAALVWLARGEHQYLACDCHGDTEHIRAAFLECYPDCSGDVIRFFLCEESAERFAALERRVAPDEVVERPCG